MHPAKIFSCYTELMEWLFVFAFMWLLCKLGILSDKFYFHIEEDDEDNNDY